jgi:hypothetical protein
MTDDQQLWDGAVASILGRGCGRCWKCLDSHQFMILCPDCGNKRCPKANDHENACTGSNDVGQPGSAYEHGSGNASATRMTEFFEAAVRTTTKENTT